MEDNLFLMVMEAGGMVEPFDAGGAGLGAPPTADAPSDPSSVGDPPPMADDGMGDMGFDMGNDGMGGDDMGGDMAGDGSGEQEEGTQNGGEKLSEKANSLLNQKLYQQMMDRNQEIEDVLENINHIVPMLPYETIKQNDESMTRLKAALDKGKTYLISNFVGAKYGENLTFFQKLDALYTLLMEQINTNLKKLKNSNDNN